jgi:hypothetical protein
LESPAVAKGLDAYSDKELEEALAKGELSERKAAIAEEILKRRRDAKSGSLKQRHGWIGMLFAAIGLAVFSLKRLWRKKPGN